MNRKQNTFIRKKVCVIGAGISGLATMKELLDLDQEVLCFEEFTSVGGVFSGDGNNCQGYDSLLLTASNYAMAFSSFPPPEGDQRHFWTAKRYVKYLNDFSHHFNLDAHIKFNSKVLSVSKLESNYIVKVNQNNTIKEYFFDSIAICSGVFAKSKLPDLPFTGSRSIEVSHTSDYKNNNIFFGKKVLSIGMGESGADIVNEVSKVAKSCHLLLKKSPPPVIPRYPKKDFTNDSYTTDHIYKYFQAITDSGLGRTLNTFFRRVGIEPVRSLNYSHPSATEHEINESYKRSHYDSDPLSRFLTKNDGAIQQKVSGKVCIHYSAIKQINGTQVLFNDGTQIEVDHIICNTGYETSYPFLSENLSQYQSLKPRQLYKNMFPIEFEGSFAFIGAARPAQGYFPALSEMQARYFAAVTSNITQLPTKKNIKHLTNSDKNRLDQMFHRESNTSLVQYPIYADELAHLIGCKPSAWRYIFQPILGFKLYFGAKVANRYRLDGMGKNTKVSKKVIKNLPVAHSWVSIISGLLLTALLFSIGFLRKQFVRLNLSRSLNLHKKS